MNDTPKKKPGKAFEPPPWEREQFEELAKIREAVEPEEIRQTVASAPEQPKTSEAPQHPADAPDIKVAAEGLVQEPSAESEERLDEAEMTELFAQLRIEEPGKDPVLWKIGLVFSGISAVVGSVLLVWGMAAMFTTGYKAAGVMGGAILLSFGGLFVGVGAWLAVRSLKERGVL